MSQWRHQILRLALFALPLSLGCTADLVSKPSDQTPSSGTNGNEASGSPKSNAGQLSINRQSVKTACEQRKGVLGVGITKLRRLSSTEFENTIVSLFGGEHIDYQDELPNDEPMGPFVSNQSLGVQAQEARQYARAAELVADNVLARGTDFLLCNPAQGIDSTCIEQFISSVVPRAFRRPLEEVEAAQLLDLYVLGRDGSEGDVVDPIAGLHLLIRAIVGSPDLLYVVDASQSGTIPDAPEQVDAPTLAARLSLAIWNAPPDTELYRLALSGELLNDEVYQKQVERLLGDARSRSNFSRILAELTGVNELKHKEKDSELYPQFTPTLVEQMLSEQSNFVQEVVFDGDGLWSTLLTTNYSRPGAELLELYGATVHENGFTLPEAQRQGLFTQAAYLSAHNKAAETSPVHLGINIREAILCETMQPPPANINTTLPAVSADIKTSRERFAAHETGACKGCHRLIDPIGLAFENYDAIGAYRTNDNGAEIDPTGQIVSAQGGDDGLGSPALWNSRSS